MYTFNALIRWQTRWISWTVLAVLFALWLGVVGTTSPALAQDATFPLPEQLTVTVRNNHIVLDWVYTVEPALVTYRLGRSESNSADEATTVTASLLSSTGDGEPVLLYYTMIDPTAQPDGAYAYWLTVTDGQGTSTTLGPLTIGDIDGASGQPQPIFLPLIISR